MFSKQSYSWGTFLVLVFKKLQDWKKSLEKFQPILLVYTRQTEAQHKCQPKLLRSKHLSACTAKAVLTLTPSSALNHMCTRQPMCPGEALQLNDLLLGTEVPQAVLTKQSPRAGTHSPGEALLIVPITLQHFASSWVSPGVCGWPRQQGRTPSTTEDSAGAGAAHPSMPSPETAAVAFLSKAGQKSSAAPATARVARWPVRDSKAKIQPLQLLWLSHLLNYAGKCARNHNLHWFSSPLPETRVNCARGNHNFCCDFADFAYLHPHYQYPGTLVTGTKVFVWNWDSHNWDLS